jgi:hypothetical protein
VPLNRGIKITVLQDRSARTSTRPHLRAGRELGSDPL